MFLFTFTEVEEQSTKAYFLFTKIIFEGRLMDTKVEPDRGRFYCTEEIITRADCIQYLEVTRQEFNEER